MAEGWRPPLRSLRCHESGIRLSFRPTSSDFTITIDRRGTAVADRLGARIFGWPHLASMDGIPLPR